MTLQLSNMQTQGNSEIDLFFRRHQGEFGREAFSMGGNQDSAYGIEAEKDPGAFMHIWRVALENGKPANRSVKIRVIELSRYMSKVVPPGEVDSGKPVFALQPVELEPVKVAGVAAEVAPNNQAKGRRRRKRRRRSRVKTT